MKRKKLRTIFTRDFNLWVNQVTTDLYHHYFPKVWGNSLKDQVITYDGRASQWRRFDEDLENLKKLMVRKPLSSPFFQLTEHKDFRRNITELRLVMAQPLRQIKDPAQHLRRLTELFSYKFTFNSLGVFLPGPWKDDFLRHHNKQRKQAEEIIRWALETRQRCEGIHKELSDYMRKWLGPMLKKHGYPASHVRLLTVKETEKFVTSGKLPALTTLEKRAKGFVYRNDKLYATSNLKDFFAKRGIELVEESVTDTRTLTGNPAYKGRKVTGKVRVVMNSDELKGFKKGEILVTSMTAPDYLPAMKKAAAIVTDEGGITCHAAIVSRELKKPCIIGTRIATKVLHDGDEVEIDTDKRIIIKL